MNDFELEQAKADFETVKNNLHEFLLNSYSDSENPENATKILIRYLDDIIEKIIKRQPIEIKFTQGASPLWYAEIFKYLSDLIEQDMKICELLSEQLDD